jgi:phage terminase large subunit-like protein
LIRQATDVVDRRPGFVRCRSEHIVLHEWAVDEGADVEDMRTVKQANPFSGITVEQLAAKRATPTMTIGHWRRFVCNLPTRDGNSAITEREWFDAATLEPAPEGADWWVGLDVGWRWDTTAFVPLCWVSDEVRLFAPAVIVEPPRDGSSTDPNLLKVAFERIQAERAVSTVVMDTNRAEDLAAWFSDELGLVVVDRAQTPVPQSEDYERFMEALRQGWLRHSGDPGLRQHALNAVTKLLPGGGAKFGRVSETRQGGNQDMRVIDALVAAAMVHSVASERAEVWASSW